MIGTGSFFRVDVSVENITRQIRVERQIKMFLMQKNV